MNENSGEVSCFLQFGFNGEGIFEFDPKTKTIITLKPELQISEQMLNDHRNLIKYVENLFSMFHPKLKIFLDYGSSSLNKKGNSCVELKVRIFHVAKMTLFTWPIDSVQTTRNFFFHLTSSTLTIHRQTLKTQAPNRSQFNKERSLKRMNMIY